MADLFLSGVVLGLAAGFSPGPLLTLVVLESLRHGIGAGVRVAAAPILTDAPIVAASFWFLSRFGQGHAVLGLVSLLGGFFVLWLAWQGFSVREISPTTLSHSSSLGKGVLVNFLSPHPYLFWSVVGSPLMLRGFAQQGWQVVVFLVGFYLFLVGSKVALAIAVGSSRTFFSSAAFRTVNRVLALLLLFFAFFLFRDGCRFLVSA